jgi:uncharacterized membrane protein
MRILDHKHYLYAIGLFLLASIAGLWSWNTLSELFSLPLAQYKHVLAAFFLLLILKWALSPGHRNNNRKIGLGYEHQNQ